jgi:DNA-binding PadR family transcriptional regulator
MRENSLKFNRFVLTFWFFQYIIVLYIQRCIYEVLYMSTRLVILGLLRDKPLYGYELKNIIEKNMGDWTSIAFGSIYFALNKLNEEGLVERVSEEKIGNRPSRSIYQITESGKEEFIVLLKEIWQKYEREYYQLDVALAFSGALPIDEVKDYIKKRIGFLEDGIKHIEEHKKEQLSKPGIPRLAKAVFSHTEYHIKAEFDWLTSILEDYNKGELP